MSRLLNLNIEDMPFLQLAALEHALQTICDVASGLQEQPRFFSEDGSNYNYAGNALEIVRGTVGFEIDAIFRLAEARRAGTKEDAEVKFRLLAGRCIDLDSPTECVAAVATLAHVVESEVRHERPRR